MSKRERERARDGSRERGRDRERKRGRKRETRPHTQKHRHTRVFLCLIVYIGRKIYLLTDTHTHTRRNTDRHRHTRLVVLNLGTSATCFVLHIGRLGDIST